MKSLKRLTLGLSKKYIIMIALYGLTSGAFFTSMSYVFSALFSDLDTGNLTRTSVFYIVYSIVGCVVYFVTDNYAEMAEVPIYNEIQKHYFNKLYQVKPEVLKEKSTGYISSLVQKAASAQADAFLKLSDDVVRRVSRLMFMIMSITTISSLVAAIMFIMFMIGVIFYVLFQRHYVSKYVKSSTLAESKREALFVDVISNVNTVQKMQATKFVNYKIKDVTTEALNENWKWQYTSNGAYSIVRVWCLVIVPIIVLVLCFTGQEQLLGNYTLTSLLIANYMLPLDTSLAIAVFARRFDRFKHAAGMLDSIIVEENNRMQLLGEPFMSLEIHDCKHSYVDVVTHTEISVSIPEFSIKRGDRVCIQGPSGQGKTTLLNIMSSEIETGKVLLNHHSSDNRLNCAFVAQDIEVMDMSLRDNLLIGANDVCDLELVEILQDVGLGSWFDSLSAGLDTALGERGVFVSSGQRQRINLARGLLQKNKDVFLLDEPTSNLDDATEALIVKLIDKRLKDKTIVVVTHRHAIAGICDKFYTFENGVLFLKEEL